VVDITKREFFAFKSEAKRWSQSDNRPLVPSTSTGSATRMRAPSSFRNLHIYLYMYMLYLVCDLTEVFSLFRNAVSSQNAASSSGLTSAASSSGLPSAASPALTSPSAGQSFLFWSAHWWFFSVCCWLFVLLLLLSKIS